MRLKEGAWLERLKNLAVSDSEEIDFPELTRTISVGELREQLLIENPGQVLVYLTDFIFSESILEKLSIDIPRKAILICESQYLNEDLDLAKANYHLTAMQAAKIARRIEAEKLILIHLSPRYGGDRLDQFLTEARELFPNTFLPDEWTREKSSDNY